MLPAPLASPLQADVARQVLEYAGVSVGEGPEARVRVVAGLSGQVLPQLRQLAALGPSTPADFVFLDHCKPASWREGEVVGWGMPQLTTPRLTGLQRSACLDWGGKRSHAGLNGCWCCYGTAL